VNSVDLNILNENLSLYRLTKNNKYLGLVYSDFVILARNSILKLLKNRIHLSTAEVDEIAHDAATRIIIRIMKRPDYHRDFWVTAMYYESIKQLWSPHRKRWDQMKSLDED